MPESQNIEYKSTWHDDHLKTICGFANAEGGKLYIGFDDYGNIIGVENYRRLMEDLPNKIRNLLGITCDVNLHEKNGTSFIEILIRSQSVAISLRGRYYKRIGSINTELTGANLNEFLLLKSGLSWDNILEESVALSEIDEMTLARFIHLSQKTDRLMDAVGLSTEQILEKLHLIENGKIKRAGIVLFGKDPGKYYPNMQVKIGKFRFADDELIYEDSEEGNLIHLITEVPIRLNRNFLEGKIQFEGIQRVVVGEYPVAAIREALINALVHRNFMGAPVQIRVYENKLSFWNEGSLPPNLSFEELDKPHASIPRNPIIADVCYKGGFIDAWGRGINKIISSCVEAGLPKPKFSEKFGGFFVELRKSPSFGKGGQKRWSEGGQKRWSESEYELSKRQKELIELIKANPRITRKKLSEVIGINQSAVQKQIEKLKELGFIKRIGPDKGGYWEVIIAGNREKDF